MARTSILHIIETPTAALVNGSEQIPELLRIYFRPWLLGILVTLSVDALFIAQFGQTSAPAWLQTLVWAPIAALITVPVVPFLLGLPSTDRQMSINSGRIFALVIAVYAVWFGSMALVDILRDAARSELAGEAYSQLDGEMEDYRVRYYAFGVMAWLTKVVLSFFLCGLVVVVVVQGRLDLELHLNLLRLAPLQLFGILLIWCFAASEGLDNLYNEIMFRIGAGQLWPLGPPWQNYVKWGFVGYLTYLPLHALQFAFQCLILVDAYQRLLNAQEETVPVQRDVNPAHENAADSS